MAIFHFSQNGIKPCSGGSAVRHSAYISGAKLYRERTGEYQRSGNPARVMHDEVVLPEGVPATFRDREVLWNAAEAAWGGGAEAIAHRANMALPIELGDDLDAYEEIVREYAEAVAERTGCAVEFAIHAPNTEGGGWHAHTLKSDLRIGRDGFERPSSNKTTKLYLCRDPHGEDCYVKACDWKQAKQRGFQKVFNYKDGVRRSKKEADEVGLTNADRKTKTPVAVTVLPDGTRAFDAEKAELVGLRELWADCCNRALEEHGIDARIDHRSNKARGMAKEPTVSLAPGDYRRELAEIRAAQEEGREAVPVSRKGEENAVRRARNRARDSVEAARGQLGDAQAKLEQATRGVLEDAGRWCEAHAKEMSHRAEVEAIRPSPDEMEEAKAALLKAESASREAEDYLMSRSFGFGVKAKKTAAAARAEVEARRAEKEGVDARMEKALSIEERADALWRECNSILSGVSRAIRSMAHDIQISALALLRKKAPEFLAQLERQFPWVCSVGKMDTIDVPHLLVQNVESGVHAVDVALREMENDRAALREECRIAAAKAANVAGFVRHLSGRGIEVLMTGGKMSVRAENGAPVPIEALDSSFGEDALLCRLYDNAIATGRVPDETCDAANLRRERMRIETERVEALKTAFLERLENAFFDYRSYCKAHRGVDFGAFPSFKGKIPNELRGDPEVRAQVSKRLRDAELLRYRYASNTPSVKSRSGQVAAHANEQPSNRRVAAIDVSARQVGHER